MSWPESALKILEHPGYDRGAQEVIGRGLEGCTSPFDLGSLKTRSVGHSSATFLLYRDFTPISDF